MYEIVFSDEATKELLKMTKSDIQAYKKFENFIAELREHPYTGTGHPHQLRHVNGIWSRQLTRRIAYAILLTTQQ